MAPYDNAFEVEAYETECGCPGHGQAPDPDCDQCGGTGRHFTTWNPMSKFDGYNVADYYHALRDAASLGSAICPLIACLPLPTVDLLSDCGVFEQPMTEFIQGFVK